MNSTMNFQKSSYKNIWKLNLLIQIYFHLSSALSSCMNILFKTDKYKIA